MTICSSCGQDNPAEFRFCGACGYAIATAPAREERKVVTVLFCDLVGFTQRAEQLDPEDVRALVAPYWEHVRAELERYGGTVEKFIGDAVMALFGAPVAHEDDPERAVRAALAIRDWAREQSDVQMRIAVATGEALVRLDADAARGEGMASGDIVNTAARLQTAAPVNAALVGETTWRATSQAIEYAARDPVAVKGKAAPVPVWEAVQPRSRFGVDVIQQSRAALVGRERELDALLDALGRAHEDRSMQVVTLVGVPGIGKSRLVYELMLAVGRRTELVTWRQGRSLPYGDGVSLWALGEMVKAQANVLETDSPSEAEAKIRDSVAALVPEADSDWIRGHVLSLVGASDVERTRGRDEAFAAWRQYLEALAEQRPAVLVFEDLHWADDNLLDFVDHLVDWSPDVPLLVIATARPELLDKRPGWGGGKRNASTLSLEPLNEPETALLIDALVDWGALPEATRSTLLERAGGNPFYAEQYVRMLLDGLGAADSTLPDTVQGIIAARLDALPLAEKGLLHDAAVIGKVFWSGALEALGETVDEELLHALVRKDFIRRERRPSLAGESEYAFRHVLTRDVAYGQIPRAARVDKHRRAAEWIASLGRPEDNAEMLAHHYTTAIALADAAGSSAADLVRPARRSLRLAGDRAFALNAFDAAARFYAGAISYAPQEDERPDLLFRHAKALQRGGDADAAEALDAAGAALLAAGDRARAAEAAALAGEALWYIRGSTIGQPYVSRALELVEGAPPSASKAWVLFHAARFAALDKRLDEAITYGREALALAEELGLEDVAAGALTYIGVARSLSGDLSGGRVDLEEALARSLAANSPEAARAAQNLGAMYTLDGQPEKALGLVEEALGLARRFGNVKAARFARTVLFIDKMMSGRWDEALAEAEHSMSPLDVEPDAVRLVDAYWGRAVIRAARLDEESALADVRRALELDREASPEQIWSLLSLWIRLHAEAGLIDEAQAGMDELVAGGPGLETPFLHDAAFVAAELGRAADLDALIAAAPPSIEDWRSQAVRDLLAGNYAQAAEQYEEWGWFLIAAKARLRAAQQSVAAGGAAGELESALGTFRRAGATLYIREAEALLATAPL